MQQESQPLFALQSQQSDLTTTRSAYTALAAKTRGRRDGGDRFVDT